MRQCGIAATPVLANVAPPPHLCWSMWHHHHHTRVDQCGTTTTWSMWHHHHTRVGQCGATTTSVLANVAPPSHPCWPMWYHHHICVGQCGTTTTTLVLDNVAPPPHLCWSMWHHHHHTRVGQCGSTTRGGQCGTTTTPVLANVALPPHRCWPVWHHHHTSIGQYGTADYLSRTTVLLNVLQQVNNDADRCENVHVKHFLKDSEKTTAACACGSGL